MLSFPSPLLFLALGGFLGFLQRPEEAEPFPYARRLQAHPRVERRVVGRRGADRSALGRVSPVEARAVGDVSEVDPVKRLPLQQARAERPGKRLRVRVRARAGVARKQVGKHGTLGVQAEPIFHKQAIANAFFVESVGGVQKPFEVVSGGDEGAVALVQVDLFGRPRLVERLARVGPERQVQELKRVVLQVERPCMGKRLGIAEGRLRAAQHGILRERRALVAVACGTNRARGSGGETGRLRHVVELQVAEPPDDGKVVQEPQRRDGPRLPERELIRGVAVPRPLIVDRLRWGAACSGAVRPAQAQRVNAVAKRPRLGALLLHAGCDRPVFVERLRTAPHGVDVPRLLLLGERRIGLNLIHDLRDSHVVADRVETGRLALLPGGDRDGNGPALPLRQKLVEVDVSPHVPALAAGLLAFVERARQAAESVRSVLERPGNLGDIGEPNACIRKHRPARLLVVASDAEFVRPERQVLDALVRISHVPNADHDGRHAGEGWRPLDLERRDELGAPTVVFVGKRVGFPGKNLVRAGGRLVSRHLQPVQRAQDQVHLVLRAPQRHAVVSRDRNRVGDQALLVLVVAPGLVRAEADKQSHVFVERVVAKRVARARAILRLIQHTPRRQGAVQMRKHPHAAIFQQVQRVDGFDDAALLDAPLHLPAQIVHAQHQRLLAALRLRTSRGPRLAQDGAERTVVVGVLLVVDARDPDLGVAFIHQIHVVFVELRLGRHLCGLPPLAPHQLQRCEANRDGLTVSGRPHPQ